MNCHIGTFDLFGRAGDGEGSQETCAAISRSIAFAFVCETVKLGRWRLQAAAGQEALEKKVGMLETHQKEIHDALLSMENEAARLYQVPSLSHGLHRFQKCQSRTRPIV